MNRFTKNVIAALLLGAIFFGLSACQKEEGPAERAGKAMDNAVEKAGEKIQDAAKDAQK